MSSAQIVSASALQNAQSIRMFGTPGIAGSAIPMQAMLNSPVSVSPQQAGGPVVIKNELLNPAAGLVRPITSGGTDLTYKGSCLHLNLFFPPLPPSYRSGLHMWELCQGSHSSLAAW